MPFENFSAQNPLGYLGINPEKNPVPSQIWYAWVSFDPSASIQDHKNVSSVQKNSVGDFTVTFSADMPSANYHISITPLDSSGDPINVNVLNRTKSSVRFQLTGGAIEILGIDVISAGAIDPSDGVSILACS